MTYGSLLVLEVGILSIYVEICGWDGCIEEEGVGGSRRVYLWEDLKLPGLSSIHDLWHRCQAGRSWSQAIQLTGF